MADWLSADEAMERLGVRPQTLYAYVSRGRIRAEADPVDPRRSRYRTSDVSALAALLGSGALAAGSIRAVIGKTEGNGGLNDFTRGYFTQSLMHLLARATGEAAEALAARIPCVLSGGTEGVLSPHYMFFAAEPGGGLQGLAIGTALGPPVAPGDVGNDTQIARVAEATRAAMARMAAGNVAAVLRGERPPDLVNPEAWDLRRPTA